MDYYYINGNINTSYNYCDNNNGMQVLEEKKSKKKGKKQSGGSKEVKLSTDPQSVAARERRHRISEKFKILKSLVPGGSKLDTVSMLEEAILYVKYLKTQLWWLMHYPNQYQYDQNVGFDNTNHIDHLVIDGQTSAMFNEVDGLYLQNVNEYGNQVPQQAHAFQDSWLQNEGAQQIMNVEDACLEYSW